MELNWLPGEAMTRFEKASLGFMRLMEESRIPRQQQRNIVNYINYNFFAEFASGIVYDPQFFFITCIN